MEPPNPPVADTFTLFFYGIGAAIAGFLAWLAKVQKPRPPVEASISGALVDNRIADPLARSLQELVQADRELVETNKRMIALMEQEVGLRQSTVEEARRMEERKALKLAIADEVREDILAEMRNEIAKTAPAPMPAIRKPRGTPDA